MPSFSCGANLACRKSSHPGGAGENDSPFSVEYATYLVPYWMWNFFSSSQLPVSVMVASPATPIGILVSDVSAAAMAEGMKIWNGSWSESLVPSNNHERGPTG